MKLYILSISVVVLSLISCTNADHFEESYTEETTRHGNDCGYPDGTHAATVEYCNPSTGYNQTFTLNIKINNCSVNQINLPNDGSFDKDHIKPSKLNSDGYCTIDGEEGKKYRIQIKD